MSYYVVRVYRKGETTEQGRDCAVPGTYSNTPPRHATIEKAEEHLKQMIAYRKSSMFKLEITYGIARVCTREVGERR